MSGTTEKPGFEVLVFNRVGFGGIFASLLLTAAFAAPALAAPPQIMSAHPPFIMGHRFGFLPPRMMGAPASAASNLKPRQASLTPGSTVVQPATFTVFDAPGAGTASGQGTDAIAVNSSSVSTGDFTDSSNNIHGFLRASDGTFTTFDVDGTLSQTEPLWMNDKGAVVGIYLDTGIYEGFLRTAGGKIETFDGSGGSSNGTFVESVNDKSEAVGDYYDASNVLHGFSRGKDGTLVQFDAPDAGKGANEGTFAYDINIGGTIVGPYIDTNDVYHGYIRAADGTFTEFDASGAGTGNGQGTVATGLNKKGLIAGFYIDASNVEHGFVRDSGGTITTFDTPDAGKGAGQGTNPIEPNNHGRVTGWYLDSSNVYHGFVRSKSGKIVEFDAPGAGTGTYEGTGAYDINRYNVIAGNEQDNSGVFHGFLRTP